MIKNSTQPILLQKLFELLGIHRPAFGWIIPFDGSIANTFFSNQLERWLKEVDVDP